MAEVASIFVSIAPTFKGGAAAISKEMGGDVEAAGNDQGKKLGGGMLSSAKSFVAPLAGLFAVSAGVEFFKGAIDGASNLSESQSKVGVVFGTAAGQIMAASKTSASAMGLSQSAYLEATGGLGNLLVSLDIAPDAAANMSQSMVTLAGDLASFNNVSPEEALAALQSGLTGETEPLKKFGINMNDATLKAEAMKLGLISSTKDAMDPQTKALAAQSLIMAQTGTAQGDFARTSGGLANQQRILAATVDDLKTKFGSVLLPVMTAVVSFLTSNLGPAFDFVKGGFFALIGAFQAGGSDVTSSGFAGGMERIGLAARVVVDYFRGSVIPAFQSFVGWLQQNAAWLTPIAVGIGAMVIAFQAYNAVMAIVRIATAAFAVVQGVLNAVILANPIGIIVLALIGLVAALVFAYQNSETFRAIVTAAWDGIKAAASAVADWFTVTIPALWASITEWTTTSWNAIGTFFSGLWTSITTTLTTAWTAVGTFLSGLWTTISSAATSAWNALKDFVGTIPGLILAFFTNWTLVGIIASHWSQIKAGAESMWNGLVTWVGEIPGRFVSGLSNLGSMIAAVATTAWGMFQSAAVTVVGTIVTFASGLPGKIVAGIGSLGSLLYNAGSSLLSGLWDGMKAKWEGIKTFVGGIATWIADHKGPISYDATLLVKHGAAIMGGLNAGLTDGFGEVKSNVSGMNAQLAGLVSAPNLNANVTGAQNGSAGASSSSVLLAELQGLRADIRALPKSYQFGQRSLVGAGGAR